MKMLVSAWPVASLCLSLSLPLLVSGCGGSDESSGDDGIGIPASIVTDADLLPGVLAAYDADDVKEQLQRANSDFFDSAPEDTGEKDCTQKKFDAITLKTSGSEYRIEGEIDFGDCMTESFTSDETYKDADFSEFTATGTFKMISYGKCEGVNLDEFNGKTLEEITDSNLCNTGTAIKATNETILKTTFSGKIKNISQEGSEDKLTYVYDYDSATYYAQRGTKGRTCSQSIKDGIKTIDDSCEVITREIATKDTIGLEGSAEESDSVNKARYLKQVYSGITGQADNTSRWYTGGMFEVTLNDWTGTVKYSSPTAEPIYEFKKGSETVTGTIKEGDE